MVIKLEDWNRDKEYDRLGLEDQYTEFLGNQVVVPPFPSSLTKSCHNRRVGGCKPPPEEDGLQCGSGAV